MKSRTLSLILLAALIFVPKNGALAQETTKLEGHERELYSIVYSADGNTLASSANDRTIRVWQLSSNLNTVIKLGYAPSKSVALTPDGSMVAGRWETGAALWATKTGEKLASLNGDSNTDGTVQRLCFSPDGRLLAVGHERGVVRLWHVNTFKPLRTIPPKGDSSNAVLSLAYCPDGSQLAIGYENGLMIVPTSETGEIKTRSDTRTESLFYTPDGKKLIANQQGNVGMTLIWNVADAKQLFAADQRDREEHFLRMLSPIDSNTALGINGNGDFESFDLNRMKRTNQGFRSSYKLAPGGFAIRPDGKYVANYMGGNLYQIYLQPIRWE